jgi:hypothetical protein
MMRMVLTVPDATLQEYLKTLEEFFGIKATPGQVSRFLKENDIVRKTVLFRTITSLTKAAKRSTST